jgi:hypothetical protein
MTRCTPLLSLTLLLAGAAGAAPLTPAEVDRALEAGTFVVDGGDRPAPSVVDLSCPDPALEEAAAPSLAARTAALATDPQAAPAPRPKAFEYSDGYRTRLKIHKYASYAMLPLFVAQYAVGQKLYNGTGSDGTRSAHSALAATTAVLFGVNTVTGVWNMAEARKDPNGKTKRTVHGLLMLAADAGFVATGMLAPEREHENELGFTEPGGGTSASTHRAVAITSMAVATVAYLMMLIH